MIPTETALIDRTRILWRALVFVLIILASKIFYFQVIRGDFFKEWALRNRFQIFYRQAPRGRIFDAKSRLIAGNTGVFNIYFNPNFQGDNLNARLSYLAKVLQIPEISLDLQIEQARRIKKTKAILTQVPVKNALRFFEVDRDFPEFFLASESLRLYPLGEDLAHLVGYLTKIQSREAYEALKPKGYRFDSWIGQFGLEKNFEDVLKGSDGAVFVEVDVHGRPYRAKAAHEEGLGGEMTPQFNQEPYPGADIVLSLDSGLSQLAHERLRASPSARGSVIGIDPQTGAVVIFAVVPGFDPNGYIRLGGQSSSTTEFPRALTGMYPPGSVFKIITSLAALENPSFDPKREFFCRGSFPTPKRVFKCWKKEGHGPCDFYKGVKFSCDVYFYHLGFMLGPRLAEWAKKFSLGKAVFIRELPQWKAEGFVPTLEWRNRTRQGWFAGDSLNMAIGQGELLVTPLQLACLVSLVANHGVLYQPYLVEAIRDSQNQRLIYESPRPAKMLARVNGVSPNSWRALEKALSLVVEEGTGVGVKIPGYKIYGKTGTAQNPLGQDHALFVCYLKDSDGRGRLALSVVVDHGGRGSVAAVPIAREILKNYIEREGIDNLQPS